MSTLISHGIVSNGLWSTAPHHSLSKEAMAELRDGLATCRGKRGLTPQAREAVVKLCADARRDGWAPEQLIVAVKEACTGSPEMSHLTTTSERDAFLAKVITACIQEYFRAERGD
jgi:hypothetical protein